jgi:hypothetical protein
LKHRRTAFVNLKVIINVSYVIETYTFVEEDFVIVEG